MAVILGPFCVLIGFIGEAVGASAGFGAIAVCFLLGQYFLSRGMHLRQSWPILLGISFLPLCLGTFVIFAEQEPRAWSQGALFIVLSLTCSLAGAALALHFSRKRLQVKGGGELLAKPSTISLADVYRLIRPGMVFALQNKRPNPLCPVGRNIQRGLFGHYRKAQAAMEEELGQSTIADMLQDVQAAGKQLFFYPNPLL